MFRKNEYNMNIYLGTNILIIKRLRHLINDEKIMWGNPICI